MILDEFTYQCLVLTKSFRCRASGEVSRLRIIRNHLVQLQWSSRVFAGYEAVILAGETGVLKGKQLRSLTFGVAAQIVVKVKIYRASS